MSFEDEDYFTCQLFSAILGGGMSSRLFQEVRENKGLCYSISSFSSSYIDSGLLGIYAGTGEEQVEELMPAIVQQLKSMTDIISDIEVQKAKAQLKAGLMMSLESASSRCEHLARQIIVYGRSIPSAELMSEIDAVNIVTPAAILGSVLTCGLWCLASVWAERELLPRPYRMPRWLAVLVVVSGVLLTLLGVGAAIQFFGDLPMH